MKKSFVSLIVVSLFSIGLISGRMPDSDTLRIVSTADIYGLAKVWAEEYSNLKTGLKVSVIETPENSQTAELISNGILGFVSARNYGEIKRSVGWHTVVARDVIVPVISSNNPMLGKLREKGVSAEGLLKIISSQNAGWDMSAPYSGNNVINYYRFIDESIEFAISAFLGTDEISAMGTQLNNSDELIEAVRKDNSGIGFCRLASVTDINTQSIKDGLAILPIDRNNNGILDGNENIYNDLVQLKKGIWIGKYPNSLRSNVYAASMYKPSTEEALAFMNWVFTEGQKFLYENGFNDLILAERQNAVEKLNEAGYYSSAPVKTRSPFTVLIILFAASLSLALAVDSIVRYRRKNKVNHALKVPDLGRVFGEGTVNIPEGIYFDKAHTWAFMEQDGLVKIGVDDFLQHITGVITRINLKNNGTRIQKGEHILSLVQNGKHLDLYAPVSGIIREHNSVLETNSGVINSSPYNEGWVYRIEPTNWHRENQLLFYAGRYRQYLSQEFTRLKDFLAEALNTHDKEYTKVVLQDGGEFREGVLSDMGPEIWEDFQTKYIDPSRQIWFYELF